jgi:transglutaminase/protease-like cytokinesis protein 3
LKAISSPGKATEEAAWEAILPAISKLKDMYEFAMQVGMFSNSASAKQSESAFPKLLAFLSADNPTSSFEKYQASAYQMATTLNFAIQFDLIKMGNPSIQNDFSYYRRTVSKMKLSNVYLFSNNN